jgi:hypothetical protein
MKFLKTKNISKFSVSDRTFIVNPYGRITTNSTNSLQIPVGNDAQRPQTSLSREGQMRINTQVLGTNFGEFEVYQAGAWRNVKFKVPSEVNYSTPIAGNNTETIFYIDPQPPATIENGATWTGRQLMVYVENVFQLYNQNFVVIENPCNVTGSIISIDNATKTITSSNILVIDFVETGFHAGQTITLSGTAGGSNDGNFTVVSVTTSTIVVNEVINTETAGATITIVGKSTIAPFAPYAPGKYIRFFDPVPSTGIYGTIYVTIISGFDK